MPFVPLIVNYSQDHAVQTRSPYQVIIGFGNSLSILSSYHHHTPYHDDLARPRSLPATRAPIYITSLLYSLVALDIKSFRQTGEIGMLP